MLPCSQKPYDNRCVAFVLCLSSTAKKGNIHIHTYERFSGVDLNEKV